MVATPHTDALQVLQETALRMWLRGNVEANVSVTGFINHKEVTLTVHYMDGRKTWKLDGKRSSYSAVYYAMRVAELNAS